MHVYIDFFKILHKYFVRIEFVTHFKVIKNTKHMFDAVFGQSVSSPDWRHTSVKIPTAWYIPSVDISDSTWRQQQYLQVYPSAAETNEPEQRENWKQKWNVPGVF